MSDIFDHELDAFDSQLDEVEIESEGILYSKNLFEDDEEEEES